MVTQALRVSSVLLLVVAIGACSSSSSKSGATTTAAGVAGQAAVTASDSLMFSPLTVTVNAGQTVTWKNGGSIDHTVTFDSGPTFKQPLNAGTTVTRTFTTAGTFAYHCSIHGPSMHGTIIVK
jgi:plastocyanin